MVTSLEELKKVKSVEEVPLPPFVDGTPFVAELKKVSLVDVICSKKIPNPIIKSVLGVMGDDKSQNDNKYIEKSMEENPAEAMAFMLLIAQKCLVSPSYSEITECGAQLTDAQVFAIFSYAMGGAEALSKFC